MFVLVPVCDFIYFYVHVYVCVCMGRPLCKLFGTLQKMFWLVYEIIFYSLDILSLLK